MGDKFQLVCDVNVELGSVLDFVADLVGFVVDDVDDVVRLSSHPTAYLVFHAYIVHQV